MTAAPTVPQVLGDYIIGETVGKGSFGKVKKGTHKTTGATVAIKIQNRVMLASSNMDKKIRREIRILKLFSHPNICRLFDVIYTDTHIFAVMEYIDGTELYNHIVECGKLTEPDARYVFQQIVCALEYCHHYRVVHRDLKPENILLGPKLTVKLIDFGLANLMKDGTFLRTSCGSPNYAAPEVISGRLYAGPEIDVWSCGVVLYALLCGCLPFDEETIPLLFSKIKKGKYSVPPHVSPEAKDLLSRLLCVDPLSRITIPQLRDHPWFATSLPKYLTWRPDRLTEHTKLLDHGVLQQVVRLTGASVDEITAALQAASTPSVSPNHRLAVAYSVLADVKRKQDIAEMESNDGVVSEGGGSFASTAPAASRLFGVQELNQGLVLTTSPGVSALLDEGDAAKNKRSYNSSNFLPASVTQQGVRTPQAAALGTTPGTFHVSGNPSSLSDRVGSIQRSVSDRVGSIGAVGSLHAGDRVGSGVVGGIGGHSAHSGDGVSPAAAARHATPLVGSVVKSGAVFTVEEEAVALEGGTGWRIGLMTDVKSALTTNEIYSALRDMGMEWRVVQPFVIAVRFPMAAQQAKGSFVLNLHLLRIQEKHDKGYVVDFELAKGHALPALEAALALVRRLNMRVG